MNQSAPAIFEQDLPPQLVEIRELIGLRATLVLVEHYGGTELRVPARYNDDHALTRIVGHAAAVTLVGRYAGDKVYIAKLDFALRVLRNIEISQRYEGGTPVNALAREYGLCERQIWNILKRPETVRGSSSAKQSSLFE